MVLPYRRHVSGRMELPLVIAGGGFIGVGSAGFYMLWQRLFASQDSDAGNHDLILGTAYASVLYFALHLIPRAVTVYLIPLVITPFFALAISLKSREINFDQPMFEDVPKKNRGVYRQAISTLRARRCAWAHSGCARGSSARWPSTIRPSDRW